MAISLTGFRKSMFFFPVFHCLRSPDKNCVVVITLFEKKKKKIVAELHSNGIVAWCFKPFSCLRTPIRQWNSHWQWMFASTWFIRNIDHLLLVLQAWRDEIIKSYFYLHRHGTHDQVICLIFLFLDQLPISEILYALIEAWKYFAWKCLNSPKVNKVYNYCLHFSWFLVHHHPPNTASDYFILIHSTVSQWLFTLWLVVLIRFTKLVIGLSKYLTGAAIKNTGHPGRQFLTASSLCALAFKLLKPPNYTGYHLLVICGDTGMSIGIMFAWKFSTIVQF